MSGFRFARPEDWPPADRALWADLVRGGDLLDEAGALSGVRESTRDSLLRRYGRWIGWLRAAEPEALGEPPERRATPRRLQAWLDAMSGTTPMSRLALLDAVLRVLSAAAPGADWTVQSRLRIVLRRAAGNGDPARKRGRILSSAVLLEAGLRHAEEAERGAPTPLEALRRRRDGALIAFLALMPMRRRALAGLRLGASLIRAPAGPIVALPPDLTKSGRPWEAPVPAAVTPTLTRYLDEVRPALMARRGLAHDMVWVGDDGRPYQVGYLAVRIGEITKRLLGVRIPPHFFRDAAATTLTRLSPKDARLVRPLLAHADYATSERHYVHAQGIEAGRDYAAVVAAMKAGRDRR